MQLTFRFFNQVWVVVLIAVWGTDAIGNLKPTEDSLWYYEIGGAEVIPAPPAPSVNTVELSGSAQLGLGFNCGNFDPVLGVANSLNDVKDGVDDMLQAMTAAATGAIASLPALILQRANPGLYDLLQNALVAAKLKVDVATKNCRQMEAAIAKGENPYHELIVISKGNDWKKAMSIGGIDPVAAEEQVDTNNGNGGVPWLMGAEAGGVNQEPLRFTGDVVQAGYNLTLSRDISLTSAPTGHADTALVKTWSSPGEAVSFAKEVLGEHVVTTCDGCDKKATPGIGLVMELQRESTRLQTHLDVLVSTSSPPSMVELEALSGPNTQLTRETVEALRELPQPERQIMQQRLVNDLAINRVLEKAFYARHLLKTGGQIPEVTSNKPAQEHVQQAIAELDALTERLLFEYQARQQVASSTVANLINRAHALRTKGEAIPQLPLVDNKPLLHGRVAR